MTVWNKLVWARPRGMSQDTGAVLHATHIIHHDLAEEHVLEHGHSFGVTQGVELLKGLEKVAEGRLVVLFICS